MQSLTRNLGRWALVMLSICVLGLAACGSNNGNGGGGNIQDQSSGLIMVQPFSVNFSQVDIGTTASEDVTITNVHDSDSLTIYSVKMKAREGGTAEDLELKNVPDANTKLGPGESTIMQVEYTAHGQANAAVIEIVSSDPTYTRKDPYTLNVDTLGNRPQVAVDPEVVRFPRLAPGNSSDQTVYVRNYGTAPLIIYTAAYSGGSDFRIDAPTQDQIVLDPYDATKAEDNPDRYELAIPVHYAPTGDGGDSGEIMIESNDTQGQTTDNGHGITTVDVQANAQAPCILVDGTTRHFGQVPIGGEALDVVSMTNCGSQTLDVSNIEISQNSADDEFGLELSGWDVNGDGQLDNDVSIAPGDTETFVLKYDPIQVGSDTGTVVISSNDPTQPNLELELVGRGSDGQCPEAVVTAKVRGVSASPRPTVSAAPLDYVILDGSQSSDPDGHITEYKWTTLHVPDGAQIQLGPTAEDTGDTDPSKREFRTLIAGTYKFGLDVIDNQGFHACNQAVATIVATPNEKIHVELTWTNPKDPDETDDSGSDVDIHLVKMGPGKWFEAPYDVYFRNPNTGASGQNGIWNPESPSLDIDDRNGAGPENIQLDDPANCEWYAVGVHYYRQLYGTAYATVRIYINQNLVYEQINKPLQQGGEFWDVARIHWDQGPATVFDVDTLMPVAPISQAPTVTDAMKSSGLCTTEGLY